jgi:hypothetical protein
MFWVATSKEKKKKRPVDGKNRSRKRRHNVSRQARGIPAGTYSVVNLETERRQGEEKLLSLNDEMIE